MKTLGNLRRAEARRKRRIMPPTIPGPNAGPWVPPALAHAICRAKVAALKRRLNKLRRRPSAA